MQRFHYLIQSHELYYAPNRVPRIAGGHLVEAAEAILDQCYSGAERNRKDLPSMVKAAFAHDEQTLNEYRLRAGTKAAEILADALYTLFTMGEGELALPATPR